MNPEFENQVRAGDLGVASVQVPGEVLLPGKSHGWRSLVGCSPWGR